MTQTDLQDYILISAAIPEELAILKSTLENAQNYRSELINAVTGTIYNKPVILVATNPGAINTAVALTAVIENQRPYLVIQTGCAGAFRRSGMKTGDIAIASCEIDIHTGVQRQDNNREYPLNQLPFPLIKNGSIKNKYPTDKLLSEKAADIISSNINGNSFYAPFITVSTITATETRETELYEAYSPCLESMEGSSAAHTSFLYNLPFIEIRSASNMVGDRNKQNWDLPLAFNRCNLAILEFIRNSGEKI